MCRLRGGAGPSGGQAGKEAKGGGGSVRRRTVDRTEEGREGGGSVLAVVVRVCACEIRRQSVRIVWRIGIWCGVIRSLIYSPIIARSYREGGALLSRSPVDARLHVPNSSGGRGGGGRGEENARRHCFVNYEVSGLV